MLVSGATVTKKRWRQVGELIVPGAWNQPNQLRLELGRWAMDNGAFAVRERKRRLAEEARRGL